MNKIKSVICVLVLTMFVFNSCVENAYEIKYQAIQKCVNKSDFVGAHEVLASITPVFHAVKKSEIEYHDFDKLQMIVYEAEIRYLVDQNDDASWKRAFFLIQEYKSSFYDNKTYSNKLELASSLMQYALAFEHEETASSIRNYMERLSVEIESSSCYQSDERKKKADAIASMY